MSRSSLTVRALTLALLCAPFASQRSDAQPPKPPDTPAASPDTSQAGAIRAYMDCQSSRCDYDFMRDQIRWVNWVRDRLFADVQLLVTSLRTGSGGSEYTITAIGVDKFKGRADTAVVFINPNDADDVARRSLARTFSLLLAPYAAKTPLASRLSLSYAAPTGGPASPKSVKDRWNFWIFRVSANGYASGEKQAQFRESFVNASANRVTANWKINIGTSLGYDESKFDLGDEGTFVNLQRNYGGSMLAVKSLGEHWSAGASANASYSDYYNQQLNSRFAGAVEYNLFPYKEFTRRQLTAYYQLGMASYRYKSTTIFGRIAENRPVHNGTIAWNARQPWGTVNVNVFGSQYLHDLGRYNYGAGGFVDLRITKGLSINLGGNYSRVADQLYLKRGELDDTQIVARQQALATNYRYYANFGVSYTFGSIFNTVVNPRFNGARGGGGQMSFSF